MGVTTNPLPYRALRSPHHTLAWTVEGPLDANGCCTSKAMFFGAECEADAKEWAEMKNSKTVQGTPVGDIVPPGLYRHFKGGLYEVIGIATEVNTRERLVVYRPTGDDRAYVARPLPEFLEYVEHNGTKVPRFVYQPGEVA
jgi:hypothetical protein